MNNMICTTNENNNSGSIEASVVKSLCGDGLFFDRRDRNDFIYLLAVHRRRAANLHIKLDQYACSNERNRPLILQSATRALMI